MAIHARIEPLTWENAFFHINSGIVRIDDTAPVLDSAALTAFQRVQAKIPAHRNDWLSALQQLGFQLVEGEADLSLSVGRHEDNPALEIASEDDIPLLRQQAAAAFTNSRFGTPWYPAGDSGRFYAQWIENAVRGSFDNECLVLRGPGNILSGFVSLRQLNKQEARIGLLAGHGAGATLMRAAQHWCYVRELTTLRVATQVGNIAALRRYIQSGATIDSTAYWLYR